MAFEERGRKHPLSSGDKRVDSSLTLLTKRFVECLRRSEDGVLDLNKAAGFLGVQKRRIYDITNVLEGISLVEKNLKNQVKWRDPPASPSDLDDGPEIEAYRQLKIEEEELTKHLAQIEVTRQESEQELQDLFSTLNSPFLYVTPSDLNSLEYLRGSIMIAVKAPPGTRLEVPDPEEAVDPAHKYQVYLKSEGGPIDIIPVYDQHFSSEEW
ncbi:transcription factor E2F1 [Polychytrium aggregatum]|uniref:transcription factor E2F1 n=1 Tax=Polychytrium aggregatum TaxID=110093 RepID=UPI0022FE1018|nr:transcription factor E2F1 [Polychytrium aggregatum]KAI9205594.1 transcription factor E2F1 [Polychytrium aggregatum]